jgi:hypothetical protein
VAVLAVTLTGCSAVTEPTPDASGGTPSGAAAPTRSGTDSAAEKAVGIPSEPTGAKRAQLLRALAAANPDIVKYEDKAIDASRNQCGAINGGGQKRDRTASQRFTYKDVTTTEAQGKQINEALTALGFCTT